MDHAGSCSGYRKLFPFSWLEKAPPQQMAISTLPRRDHFIGHSAYATAGTDLSLNTGSYLYCSSSLAELSPMQGTQSCAQ